MFDVTSKRKYPNDPNWRNRPRAPGGGRKPKWSTPTTRIQATIPVSVKTAMIQRYGGIQAAIDVLVIEPIMELEETK